MFIYWVDEPEVREGTLLAFFTDLNNPNGTEFSMCYIQFQKIRVLSMKVYDTGVALASANETDFWGYRNIKDELFFGIQEITDIWLEGFQLYDDCGLEQNLIQGGRKVSWAVVAEIIKQYYIFAKIFTDQEWQAQVVKQLNKANFSGEIAEWEKVGYYIGRIAAEILGFKVPAIEYLYGESIMKEMESKIE